MKPKQDRPPLLTLRLTRRRMLRAGLLGGMGLAGLAVVGCGGGEEAQPPENTTFELTTPVPGLAPFGWQQLEPSGDLPAARTHHSLVRDDADGRVYLFGGRSAGTALNDLWALDVDPPAWTRLQPQGLTPPPRFGHNAVFDPRDERVLVFAGQAGDAFLNDLWAFAPQDNVWTAISAAGTAPPPRQGAGAALDEDAGRLYVTHGLTAGGYVDDTWALDLASATWEEVTPSDRRPPPRSWTRAAWDPSGKRLFLFGGEAADQSPLGDLWAFDPEAGTWEEVPQGDRVPSPRSQHAAVFLPDREWLLVFGGVGTEDNLIWFYVPSVKGWGTITPYVKEPGDRAGHDMVFVPPRFSIVLFGGTEGGQEVQELWELGVEAPENPP